MHTAQTSSIQSVTSEIEKNLVKNCYSLLVLQQCTISVSLFVAIFYILFTQFRMRSIIKNTSNVFFTEIDKSVIKKLSVLQF